MMSRTLILAASISTLLLAGCDTTALQRQAQSAVTSVQAAVTPREVMTYKAYADAARPVLDATNGVMKHAGYAPRVEVGNVTFRDSIGRRYDSPLIAKTFRFAVPQDAVDAESKELQPMFAALGARLVEWNAVEALELIAVSSDNEGADYLVTQMHKAAPGLKVTKQVGPLASAGYSGIEMRMVNTNLNRQLAASTTASAAK
ncbi:hypothetical protein [Scleromatobacter humisilvae]|uniref:Uncharacterized protein n=1 Tax=Scleromatobacter humisilvae TaxID=2897159 RepID=A0A9X2C2W7_9BURK|nr:hypothetical protein [Scleromatobacter humisilvae]MCK9687304.1 hypothetical protein [Scleromatobacter humisilvae]